MLEARARGGVVEQTLDGGGHVSAVAGETAAMKEAAEVLGWDVTVIDGAGDPALMTQGILRAIDEGADGSLGASVPDGLVTTALAKARAAGIPVVSVGSGNTPSDTGFNAEINSAEFNILMGSSEAYYAIADSDGTANVLVLNSTSDVSAGRIYDATIAVLKECPGCTFETLDFTTADTGQPLAALVTTALARNPDINYIAGEYSAAAESAAQAIEASGRSIKLLSTGGERANMNLIAKGTQEMTTAISVAYAGWFGVDTMNRIMNGAPIVPYTPPVRILYSGNLPSGDSAWDGDEDYKAPFKEIWGK